MISCECSLQQSGIGDVGWKPWGGTPVLRSPGTKAGEMSMGYRPLQLSFRQKEMNKGAHHDQSPRKLKTPGGLGVSLLVEHLPGRHKVLDSSPSTANTKQNHPKILSYAPLNLNLKTWNLKRLIQVPRVQSRLECSHGPGGCVNWYNHCGNLLATSSKATVTAPVTLVGIYLRELSSYIFQK